MAHYTVKFACGHTAEIQLFGKESERQRKIKYFEENGICPACYRKQQEEAKKAAEAQAAAEANEMGLPELTGSEKQVAWANKIRNGLMESISKMQDAAFKIVESIKTTGEHQEELPKVEKAIEFINACEKVSGSETSAAKIIDWSKGCLNVRHLFAVQESDKENIKSGKETPESFVRQYGVFFVEVLKILYAGDKAGEAEKVSEDITLAPEKKTTDTLAVVQYTDERVAVSSPKDHTVMKIAKDPVSAGADQSGEMQITVTTGSAIDRAAEIANKLLAAGVQVRVPATVQKSAVDGNYAPRCTRWFYARKDDQKMYAEWGNDEDWYNRIINLSGAKYARDLKRIRIPASSADEIEDFAELNGFQITGGAKKNMAGYRAKMTIVSPQEKAAEEKPDEKEKLHGVLESSREIIEDLKDD